MRTTPNGLGAAYLELIDSTLLDHSEFVRELTIADRYEVDELNLLVAYGVRIHINKVKNVEPPMATTILEHKDLPVNARTTYRNDEEDLILDVLMQNENTKSGKNCYCRDEVYEPEVDSSHLSELKTMLASACPILLQPDQI